MIGHSMTVRVEPGDCIKVMERLGRDGVRVDAVVTDPPYHLTSGKRGGFGDASVNLKSPAGRSRISTGFMSKQWDGGDVSFRQDTWRLCFDLLPPGGHLVAFGGTRTYHRLTCAIEDAGFEIRDMIAWLYGTGFPKSHNLDGDRAGWGTALKPALEPIVLARKSLAGTVAATVAAHGTGALNIDGCRVAAPGGSPSVDRRAAAKASGKAPTRPGEYGHTIVNRTSPERFAEARPGEQLGRWPANVVHDGSDEVVDAFPNAPGQQRSVGPEFGDKASVNVYGDYGPRGQFEPRNDSGSAARFFYAAKADAADRLGSRHPTVKPVDLICWLARLVTPPGGTILDPFAGTGTTGAAAMREGFDAILIEREPEYLADIERRLAHVRGADTPLFEIAK